MKTLEKNTVLSSLVSSQETICHDIPTGKVADKFFRDESMEAMAVLNSQEPIGLVTRTKFMYHVMKRYGYDLFKNKPVHHVADLEPLILHENESPDTAINKALERDDASIYDEIILIDDHREFRGLVSVKQMIVHQSSALAGAMLQKEIERERAIELEKMSEIRSQFLSHVTHELRAPVNTIIGLAELIRYSVEKSDEEEIIKKLSILSSSASHLRNIVTNILDLSKIEAGKMDIITEEVNIRHVCEDVLNSVRVLAGDKNIKVRLRSRMDADPVIVTDPVKLKQILINLGSNAAKFTEKGEISFSYSHHKSGRLKISVCDTGIGIKKEDIAKLFEAFNQLEDAKTKRHEGTGLGLAIVKNLVKLLRGRLAIKSFFGKGTKFNLYLPYKIQE